MATEIELKYFVLEQNVAEQISQLLSDNDIEFKTHTKQLSNCYFDTPDLALRKLDMGLRVRTFEDNIEQTIKTSGSVVAGLHQRPEYNIDIEQTFPDLALFPKEIWREGRSPEYIQQALISLFNTNFERITWLVIFNGSTIELAFDKGVIESGGRSDEINEIEIELVEGNTKDIFALAQLLFTRIALRPGTRSKAARGYALWRNEAFPEAQSLEIVHQNDGVLGAFINGVGQCLNQIQCALDTYFYSERLQDLSTFVDAMASLRHGFWLFNDYMSPESRRLRAELSHFIQLFSWVDNAIYLRELMNKTGNYRKKLDYSEQLVEQLKLEKRRFPDKANIAELLYSERFNQLQLALLNLLVSKEPSDYFCSVSETTNLRQFARQKLSDSLAELHKGVVKYETMDVEQFIEQRPTLHRSLLTGAWFGSLFEGEVRQQFRMPWLDIQQGLSELQTLWIIHQQLEKLEEQPIKIVKWQHSKVENLLNALTQSIEGALSMAAYWND